MRCSTSNIQLETIISRIRSGSINLQPDFQRGEVWSLAKQKKLIDTILRKWTMPPIHIVPSKDDIDEVLDGQQRLVSVRDFINGRFAIDGNIQPLDEFVQSLNGLKYDDLDEKIKARILRYEITFITLMDYKPSEPAELFERLNQPTKLTSSEQRNAYIGKTRSQIKSLVEFFEYLGANNNSIGFSNSRLAYDEIIAKFCYAIEIKTLRRKIVASDITEKYRDNNSFTEDAIQECKSILSKFIIAVNKIRNDRYSLKLNKATIYSWFVFIKQNNSLNNENISSVIYAFETFRDYYKGKNGIFTKYQDQIISEYIEHQNEIPYLENMINIFNQKSSMGSTDVLSIIYRDIILFVFSKYITNDLSHQIVCDFRKEAEKGIVTALEFIYNKYYWGMEF